MARIAPLSEIETSWSLNDILAANELLIYQQEAEFLAYEKAKNG